MWISRLKSENGSENNNSNSSIVPFKMPFGTWTHHRLGRASAAATSHCKQTVRHVDHVIIFIQIRRNAPVLQAELGRPSETIWTGGITLQRGGEQPGRAALNHPGR